MSRGTIGTISGGGGGGSDPISLGWGATGYYPVVTGGGATTIALTLNTLYAGIFPVTETRTFDRIGVEVSTQASAGGVLRFGIYNNVENMPATVLLDAGTVDSTTTGAKTITISQSLTPDWYWLVVVAQVAACTVRARNGPTWGVAPALINNSIPAGQSMANVTDALPTWVGTIGAAYQQSTPVVMLRAA